MKKLIELLKTNNLTISIAESMTGGYLSHLLTKDSGASNYFNGAIIAYSKDVKVDVLNVPETLITQYSVVSEEVAIAMAKGLKSIIKSNIYVAVTGNAGPNLDTGTNKLESYIAIIFNNKTDVFHIDFNSNERMENIKKTTNFIFKKLTKMI